MRVAKATLEALCLTKSDKQIADLYGVTARSVCDWRLHYNIPAKPRESKYSLDRDFFAVINTKEKAYVLGLLAADGSVHRSGKQVSLVLQAGDEELLVEVRRAIGSSAPIYDKAPGAFPGSKPRRGITFDSKKLVADLARYSVGPGKSHTLQYPKLPANLEHHFARGAFDGDGHIRAFPKKAFYFLGTSDFIDGLRLAIARHTGLTLRKTQAGGCCRLSGYGNSTAVLHWMYQDATIFLGRKYRVYLDHWR